MDHKPVILMVTITCLKSKSYSYSLKQGVLSEHIIKNIISDKMADEEENQRSMSDRKCSLPVLSRSQEKVRKSSLVTIRTGIRKTSAVSFEEKNTMIDIEESGDVFVEDKNEVEDTLGDLREAKCDEEGRYFVD
jgi:hypothetical protein